MNKEQEIEIGQRFESLGIYKRRVWEVVDIYATPNRVAHAKLRDARDQVTVCTLAVVVLLDADRFRALEPDEALHVAPRAVLPKSLFRCAERASHWPDTGSAGADQTPLWLDLRGESASVAPGPARSESSRR